MSSPVIVCRNAAKTYADGRVRVEVLKGVNLEVSQGESVAIVGASGAGKSTLLHILGGLDHVTEGQVQVAGRQLAGMSQKALGQLRNRHLGFIYQFHHLLPEFSALENVAMPLLIAGKSRADARDQARELLERVGLAARLDHKPGQLSGGERQRAAVARALVTQPDCVLADEPTGNLDEDNAAGVYQMMLQLNREFGTSLVIVTHDQGLAAQLDRRLTLHSGQLHPD